ncbi:MAG TPA: hypothetical protein VMU29_04620 [Smithella sp.]|nr:hypothetical protein [Smithella sp.]
MKKIIIPFLIYIILACADILFSGAPLRVHVLSLAVLFIAVPVSPLLCGMVKTFSLRIISCFLCALLSLLIWDSTAQLVLSKGEFLFMLKYYPWIYPIDVAILGAFIFLISFINERLTNKFSHSLG